MRIVCINLNKQIITAIVKLTEEKGIEMKKGDTKNRRTVYINDKKGWTWEVETTILKSFVWRVDEKEKLFDLSTQ